MQQVDKTRIEMIRRLEKAGFRYLNKSFLARKVQAVPSIDDLAGLVKGDWWSDPSAASDFLRAHDGGAPSVGTKLRVVYDDQCLFAALYMHEPRVDKTNAHVTEPGARQMEVTDPVSGQKVLPYVIEKDDSAQLMLDFSHSHSQFVSFFVNMAGIGYAEQAEASLTCEAVYPHYTSQQPWTRPHDCKVKVGDDYWVAAFRIPWSSAGISPADGKALGINAVRGRTVGQWEHHCLCYTPVPRGIHNAADFGDLYLEKASIELEEVDFGWPVVDDNRFTVKLRNRSEEKVSVNCRAEVVVQRDGHKVSQDQASVDIQPGRSAQVQMGYTLDWREDWRQVLTLTVSDSRGGTVLLTSPYFFSYRCDITADQPHQFDGPRPNPSPDDDDFIVKKRYYLLSRIPVFLRATTQEGAPSDFTLRSTCGKHQFDLMQPGAMKRIAAMIEQLFKDPTDRLAAATLLSHHKAFSMHVSPHVALHTQITPLSALRLNAGHCYSRALVWMGIVRNMSAGDGRGPYGDRTHCVLVLGHVIGCIDVGDDDRWLFDPTVGSFFYAWDNKRFATEKELEADPALAGRMLRTRSQNFTNVKHHRAIPAGQIVFPQGAVAD